MKQVFLTLAVCCFAIVKLQAQDDLMKMLEDRSKKDKKERLCYSHVLKTHRLINKYSIEKQLLPVCWI